MAAFLAPTLACLAGTLPFGRILTWLPRAEEFNWSAEGEAVARCSVETFYPDIMDMLFEFIYYSLRLWMCYASIKGLFFELVLMSWYFWLVRLSADPNDWIFYRDTMFDYCMVFFWPPPIPLEFIVLFFLTSPLRWAGYSGEAPYIFAYYIPKPL